MRKFFEQLSYILATIFYTLLSALFIGVLSISVNENLVDMVVRIGLAWNTPGNYCGFFAGIIAYLGWMLISLCIPIYTLMILPFRFAGNSAYMIFFDCLITFSYMFHLHSFAKQTRPQQSDISNCGLARSASFISFIHLAMISLIVAIPKGGLLNALCRVFGEYPAEILSWVFRF